MACTAPSRRGFQTRGASAAGSSATTPTWEAPPIAVKSPPAYSTPLSARYARARTAPSSIDGAQSRISGTLMSNAATRVRGSPSIASKSPATYSVKPSAASA